ncbi:MAG: phospho-N-acetylmuramoyl-pentapeptide-transferase [Patescibacteria group bacterium]|jgi:phospho-N-acetylmuramoyl-pentapeptide-transferase
MVDAFAITKILILGTASFLIAIAWTPALTHFLYKYRLGKTIRSAVTAPMFAKLHAKKAGVPTMGGALVWGTVGVLAFVLAGFAYWMPQSALGELSFLSRSQTWLPIAALIAAGVIGLADDFMNVLKIGPHGGGIHIRHRLFLYALVAAVGAWWFTMKLGFDALHVPFIGDLVVGPIPYALFFIAVIVSTSFSVNQTDGLDGLAGGTVASAFGAYSLIAVMQGRYDLAAFCAVVMGALFAFLWFNIYPARFIMGDTGAMSLGVTLGVVAMLTNQPLLLPLIGFVFVIEMVTTILQILSKKLFGKKIFRIAPIHHHFEAIGWPEPKVVMRFWVISWITAVLGVLLAILDVPVR